MIAPALPRRVLLSCCSCRNCLGGVDRVSVLRDGFLKHGMGPQHLLAQTNRFEQEYSRIHQDRIAHDWPEFHMGKDVFLDVNAGRHFDEFQTLLHQAEHAALGYVYYVLSPQVRVFPAESAMFDLAHKLLALALAIDVQLAARNRKLKQLPSSEGA